MDPRRPALRDRRADASTSDGQPKIPPTLANMEFRLTAPAIDFWVDVRLRSWGDRWLAVADIAGEPEIGLGRTAGQALEGALASFGQRTALALLADLSWLAESADTADHDRSAEADRP